MFGERYRSPFYGLLSIYRIGRLSAIHVSGYVPTIASDAKVLLFGDFSYYWIGDRQGRTFDRLNELFAATDQVGFKATQRVDGRLVLPEAVKVLKMGSTGGSGGE